LLTLTLKPGEYVDIGDNIRFVFTGGTVNNIHVLVEAPKDLVIYRSKAPDETGKSTPKATKADKSRKKDKSEESLEARIERIFEGC
jgi:carbon storage regulator